jgi:sugar phosphate isomerase/epimerase
MSGYGLAIGLRSGQTLQELRGILQHVAASGFTHAEIQTSTLGVVINGQVHPRRLDVLREAIADSPVRFTVHGAEVSSSRGGNLVDVTDPLQRLTVKADIEIAAAIGATVVVYHSGTLRAPGGTPAALHRGMAFERQALQELGGFAAASGIVIAVENRDPVARYIDRLVYGMSLERLARQIEEVDHPNVGICFDTGHAFLAAAYLDFDYLEGVRRIAPLTRHIHLSDNLGQPMLDETSDPAENLIQGLGDLHLLPGWGAVPFDEIAEIPFPGSPISIVELRGTFLEHASEAADAAARFANTVSGAVGARRS